MAKYFNNQKKTGKVAGSVFAIRFGETIERAYNPVVANPSTDKQVEARAKLKLISQLATVLANDIAIPRVGSQSPRNLFVKRNYGLMSFANSQADIDLNMVQLTSSVVGMVSLEVSRTEQNIRVELGTIPAEISRVIYVGLMKRPDGTLTILGSTVVSEPGSPSAAFVGNLPLSSSEVVVLAYGVRDNTENARAIFGDMQAVTAEQIAKLIVTRALLENDVTLTETVGKTLAAAV